MIKKKRNWRYGTGKRINKLGYRVITVPDGRVMFEHRYVMEKHLGRKLTKKEVVHHIDENRSNNKIQNLHLYKSHSQHVTEHPILKFKVNWTKYKIPPSINLRRYGTKLKCVVCYDKVKCRSLCKKHHSSWLHWIKRGKPNRFRTSP